MNSQSAGAVQSSEGFDLGNFRSLIVVPIRFGMYCFTSAIGIGTKIFWLRIGALMAFINNAANL